MEDKGVGKVREGRTIGAGLGWSVGDRFALFSTLKCGQDTARVKVKEKGGVEKVRGKALVEVLSARDLCRRRWPGRLVCRGVQVRGR